MQDGSNVFHPVLIDIGPCVESRVTLACIESFKNEVASTKALHAVPRQTTSTAARVALVRACGSTLHYPGHWLPYFIQAMLSNLAALCGCCGRFDASVPDRPGYGGGVVAYFSH